MINFHVFEKELYMQTFYFVAVLKFVYHLNLASVDLVFHSAKNNQCDSSGQKSLLDSFFSKLQASSNLTYHRIRQACFTWDFGTFSFLLLAGRLHITQPLCKYATLSNKPKPKSGLQEFWSHLRKGRFLIKTAYL